jgi:hypothetical protein
MLVGMQDPTLVFEDREFPLRRGVQTIGRGADADIVIAVPELSRQHALLFWDGVHAALADAGSRNGTHVNGEAVIGRRPLAPGDEISLGGARLRFALGAAQHATRELSAHVGRDNHGNIWQAGRDLHIENRTVQEDGWDELFEGQGFGRLLLALGGLIALAGFAGWGYLIISAFGITDPTAPTPFDTQWLGLPALGVAGAAFLGGGILAGIGSGLSKARRRRGLARV